MPEESKRRKRRNVPEFNVVPETASVDSNIKAELDNDDYAEEYLKRLRGVPRTTEQYTEGLRELVEAFNQPIDPKPRRLNRPPLTFEDGSLVGTDTTTETAALGPISWVTGGTLERELNTARHTIAVAAKPFEKNHPDWFKYTPKGKLIYIEYHPKLVDIIQFQLEDKDKPAPENWLCDLNIVSTTHCTQTQILEIVEVYRATEPKWFKYYRYSEQSRSREYYAPELVKIILEQLKAISPERDTEWPLLTTIAIEIIHCKPDKIREKVDLYKQIKPSWIKEISPTIAVKNRQPTLSIHPKLVEVLKLQLENRDQKAPDDWIQTNDLERKFKTALFKRVAGYLRLSHPQWIKDYLPIKKSKPEEFIHPELVSIINYQLEDRDKVAPDAWLIKSELAPIFHLPYNPEILDNLIEPYRKTNPKYFKYFRSKKGGSYIGSFEHYHPDMIASINSKLESEKAKKKETSKVPEKDDKQKIVDEVKEFKEGKTLDAQTFARIIALCGSSRAADLLYQFRPGYRLLPPEYVRSVLGEYMGDFLAVQRPFQLENLVDAAPYLKEPSLREGLVETLKRDCLTFYYHERKALTSQTDKNIINAYLDKAVGIVGDLHHPDIDDVIQEITIYFSDIFTSTPKPDGLVDTLGLRRDFPDINQRINTKELAEKKRLLIADEMGLGKSASVIFAKESLKIGTALLVVPSNVIATWRGYLSDQPDQKGYFKAGQQPRVLIIEKVSDLVAAQVNKYDYIIIAQERLNEKHLAELTKIQFDILITDEVHKLKNPAGKRSAHLLELAKKVQTEDKYIALLSATPAPNGIEDLAVSLKLLYPTEYGDIPSRVLARQIVTGDVLDLRSRLLARMQMKNLEDSVEMPALNETIETIELSEIEKSIYEALVEEDEMESTTKFTVLRKFLLNPKLVDATPGIESRKVTALKNDIKIAFQTTNKVVVFINDYITGVLRDENNIIDDLDIPSSIQVRRIHGGNREERDAIQREFANYQGQMLLLVSGHTSDVGVDFSSGGAVIHYNEPLTEDERRQQRSRVYRPGVKHDVEVKSLIVAGTVEEGIHFHIKAKFKAVEKVLRGIPLNELEKHILESVKDENLPEADVDPELANFYFSALQRLRKMFSYLKEKGEVNFKKFLEHYAKSYAEGYRTVGARSYQANVNRLSSALVDRFALERQQKPSELRILDIPSGPEMLRQHSQDKYQKGILSVDLNSEHFTNATGEHAVGSFTALPCPDQSFDYINCALGLHYTSYIPTKGNYERLQALHEMNRVLKVGGRVVINEMYSLEFRSEAKFTAIAKLLGFRVVQEYTGLAESGKNYQSQVITLEKTQHCTRTIDELSTAMNDNSLNAGLKWDEREGTLKDSRKILNNWTLGEQTITCELNKSDRTLQMEEQHITELGEQLRNIAGSIVDIPRQQIINNGFIRVKAGKKYILFKQLTGGNGAVIIREAA